MPSTVMNFVETNMSRIIRDLISIFNENASRRPRDASSSHFVQRRINSTNIVQSTMAQK